MPPGLPQLLIDFHGLSRPEVENSKLNFHTDTTALENHYFICVIHTYIDVCMYVCTEFANNFQRRRAISFPKIISSIV